MVETGPLTGIAFVARSETRFFLLALARALKERHSSRLHLYCNSQQEVEFYECQNREGLFASVTDAGTLMKRCGDTGLDEGAVIARARAFEEQIGCTYNHLAVCNRHLGRGYALGGFYHPRSNQSEKTSYTQFLHAYNETLAFWEREFREKRITLVLNGGKEAAVMARAHGLPFRAMAGSRFKDYHYWAWNEFRETPLIEEAFGGDAELPPAQLDAPYDSHSANRKRSMKSFGLGTLLERLAMTTARHTYWHLRGYEAAKNYLLRDMLRLSWRRWADYRRLRRLTRTKLYDLEGRSFVFFPLHVEPEAALQIISPEYFCQLSAIAALSRDLPAGTMLAVKEHFGAIGRRPDNFYAQIAEFKNVVLLDTWELGFDCVRQSDAVATICGTAGMEGAVMGKPVIAFGRHNIYSFLPHVKVVRDETKLRDYLHDALAGNFDQEEARAAGQRFLQAVVAASFDMRGYDCIHLHDFKQEAVKDASDALVRSLDARAGERVLRHAV